MAPGRLRGYLGSAVLLLLLGSEAVVAGCGSEASVLHDATVSAADSILSERYDALFPDNRMQTVRVAMTDADWKAMQADYRAKQYFRADIWFDGEPVRSVAIRTKGSSSLMQGGSAGKFGMKVDFSFFNADQTHHGIKKLCFNNGFSDSTLMKEFLGYELMALMGLPTPRACFVDLWVNESHMGVYTQVEAVDGRFVAEHFETKNGDLYKPELGAGRLDWVEEDVVTLSENDVGSTTTSAQSLKIGGGDLQDIIDRLGDEAGWIPGHTDGATATTLGFPGVGAGGRPGVAGGPGGAGPFSEATDLLTSIGLRTNEDRADYSRLYDMLAVVNSPTEAVSADDLEKVLDVDEILRFLAVSVALVHLDNYIGAGHNYYLYENEGVFEIIPWDLNMCFAGFTSDLNDDALLGFFIDEPTAGPLAEYPLVAQLLAKPEFMDIYHAYLQQLIDGPFSVQRMSARIREIATLILPAVAQTQGTDLTLDHFERGLNRFVEARTESIAAQLSGRSPASSGDGSGNGGSVGIGGAGRNPGEVPGQSDSQSPGQRLIPTRATTVTTLGN